MPPKSPITPSASSILIWLRRNLFSTWYNCLLTVISLWIIYLGGRGLFLWMFSQAQWTVLQANLRLFFVGRFPLDQIWRVWLIVLLVSAVTSLTAGVIQWNRTVPISVGILTAIGLSVAPLVGGQRPELIWVAAIGSVALFNLLGGPWLKAHLSPRLISRGLPSVWFLTVFMILWLLMGGLGLSAIGTNVWQGLLLTVLTAVVSIALSFPIGVLLALGRRSSLPVIRTLCILYIEVIRGLPLIGVLFIAGVMLPLVLPSQVQLDAVLRAICGLTLFSAAYLAENVRGGLQSIPQGQMEAAKALGLNPVLVLSLVVLPQALRSVIPTIVGQFIGLFKDTSLLSIIGLVELTGISRSVLSQPRFIGRHGEVYLFIGLLYWLFCYLMSLGSRRLERQLGVK
ncbi:amino acid ABC transporter permease [Acaryochloris sp. 'Moss Beach']|uniref:amino acid ABC transporter permease n=1 Tax=Acaryochloris sp. 'Moss Beach' TaxID=2740837 RepID=UPI0028F453B0|nr:amino acid ABC transporter permease [Acaryochloris sp. 'Moss Beach']UJB71855.1 amino acid ABC transporter permease [Acaryochloris sp. 'Moss Beach']